MLSTDEGADQFRENFIALRRTLALLPKEKRWQAFGVTAREVAGLVAGGCTKADAVDELYRIAAAHGFFGQSNDAVQAAMADGFKHPLLWSSDAADSTVEAVMYGLREDGKAAIRRNIDRLRQCSPRQIMEILRRLDMLRSKYPAKYLKINDDLIRLIAGFLP
jgi:hypothetical protein